MANAKPVRLTASSTGESWEQASGVRCPECGELGTVWLETSGDWERQFISVCCSLRFRDPQSTKVPRDSPLSEVYGVDRLKNGLIAIFGWKESKGEGLTWKRPK